MSVSMSFNDKTVDSQVSNPEPEPVFIGREGTENFRKSIMWILIDLIVTIFLILEEFGLFEGDIERIKLIIVLSIALVIFALIMIFVLSHITILVLLTKYFYIIVGSIYYAYKLLMAIIFLITNESDISNLNLVVFVIILASIIPRIMGFYNIELFAKVCKKVDEIKRILDHEKLIEKIGNKVDRGGYSRWSNTLEIERLSSANISSVQDSDLKNKKK